MQNLNSSSVSIAGLNGVPATGFRPTFVEPEIGPTKIAEPLPFTQAWRKKRRAVRRLVETLTPIHETSPRDVFVVGYPKSGNTWFQDLIAAVVYGVNPLYAPPALVQTLAPDVHGNTFYKRISEVMYFKSHNLPRPAYRRVVYLVRDGRDALVSFNHYNQALGGRNDLKGLVENAPNVPYGRWHEHVNAWLENPHDADMLIIRYEDLMANTARELERFCIFAGILRDPKILQMAAEGTRFDKMQQREILMGQGDPLWPKDKLFRRRGVVGSHHDEMPPEVLTSFMEQAGETLSKLGYE